MKERKTRPSFPVLESDFRADFGNFQLNSVVFSRVDTKKFYRRSKCFKSEFESLTDCGLVEH